MPRELSSASAAGPIAFGLKPAAAPAPRAVPPADGPARTAPATALSHLLAVGLDYDQLARVRLDGKPVVYHTDAGKIACLVSKRQFADEGQLRKHVAKSKLYREAFERAANEGRVSLAT